MANGFGTQRGPQPAPWPQQQGFPQQWPHPTAVRPQPGSWPGQGSWPGPPGGSQFPGPGPRPSRGMGPLIIVGIGLLGLIMLGLVLNSLFSGPDYQNEEYVPPPPGAVTPLPDGQGRSIDDVLTRNSLYAQTAPRPVRCELSDPELNVNTANDSDLRFYLDELMACNMRVWDPPFRATGEFELVRPAANVYRGSVSTPCGQSPRGPNAFYCPANQEIYLSRELSEFLPRISEPHGVDMVVAHEFAHGIQARTLIIQANSNAQVQVDDRAALELNRRLELQADCLAGVWVQSVAQSLDYSQADIANLIEAAKDIGDDRLAPNAPEGNHGRADSRAYWIQVGMSGNDVARCQTFTAPSDFVR